MPAAESQIRINTLLLEREALFVHVHKLEGAIDRIFGETFPYTRPPLPSDKRSKKKHKAKAKAAKTAIKLRKLDAGESAYRLIYQQGGVTLTEQHDNPDALNTLLAAQGDHLKVRSIETLDQTGTPQALLFGTPLADLPSE